MTIILNLLQKDQLHEKRKMSTSVATWEWSGCLATRHAAQQSVRVNSIAACFVLGLFFFVRGFGNNNSKVSSITTLFTLTCTKF